MNKYKAFSLRNINEISQLAKLPSEGVDAINVVGHVLPFKTNNYVIENLIDWDKVPNDPIFTLTFPRKEMLSISHFRQMADKINKYPARELLADAANQIRRELNPHPAGQISNIPNINGVELPGIQHKYRETVLFFPNQGQTCHAYCTFCFRWPQFTGMSEIKFAMKEVDLLKKYLMKYRNVTDVLFTGGDPMIMSSKIFSTYIEPLIDDNLSNIQTIRIGTKALGYWPYRFTTDSDADDLLRIFEKVIKSGRNLAIMAHFNHPVELSTNAVMEAISRIRSTGAQIRTQSPILNHINNSADVWAELWRKQVNLNLIPYYMFIARDTGAQHFFEVPLVEAWKLFRNAYQMVSGVCRTVRGPSMSTNPGKIQILGVSEIKGEKVIVLRFIQGRNSDWVARPFFAQYDSNAVWFSQLKPAFNESKFFFEDELEKIFHEKFQFVETDNFE